MLFNGERATNITPDKISGKTVSQLLAICDEHLIEVVKIMRIKKVIAVGKYLAKRGQKMHYLA